MPAIFLHGVPDTFRVWDSVIEHTGRPDCLALALPGFDAPLPDGFTATKEAYVDWIVRELERQSEPVDLVGHDWGCLFAARVASLRPDLLRTWAAGNGPVSAEYEWHPLAKIFQTPGEGERFMDELDPARFTAQLREAGVPEAFAAATAARVDAPMKQAILSLYRSAVHVGHEWQPALAHITATGLVLWGREDRACPVRFAGLLARDTGARRVLELPTGHWFPLEAPQATAQALLEHWR